nr:hypothetical protein [Candidatus Frankia alpina]
MSKSSCRLSAKVVWKLFMVVNTHALSSTIASGTTLGDRSAPRHPVPAARPGCSGSRTGWGRGFSSAASLCAPAACPAARRRSLMVSGTTSTAAASASAAPTANTCW